MVGAKEERVFAGRIVFGNVCPIRDFPLADLGICKSIVDLSIFGVIL